MTDLELGGALIKLLDEIRMERTGTRPGSGCYYIPSQERFDALLSQLGALLRAAAGGERT